MTSSFVKILARHDGPWKFYASLPPDAKGRPVGAWIPEKSADPVNDAFELMEMKDVVQAVHVWSESEQQFVLIVEPGDRTAWETEKENWKQTVKVLAKERSAEIAASAPPKEVKIHASLSQVAEVLRLRAEGLGYVKIDTELLGSRADGKPHKGFWSWNIVKNERKKTENKV